MYVNSLECIICQPFKGRSQNMERYTLLISNKPWADITMGFVVGLPKPARKMVCIYLCLYLQNVTFYPMHENVIYILCSRFNFLGRLYASLTYLGHSHMIKMLGL